LNVNDFVDKTDRGTYSQSNPRQDREADAQRRANAQARKPLIAKWDPNIPAGYLHVDDAIIYMQRRWGNALRAEMLEAFSRDDTGPRWTIFGDFPDKSRGERYYMFEDIDMWVYRTFSGLPASWRETRHIRSSVPVTKVEDLRDGLRRPLLDGTKVRGTGDEEQSDGRTGIKEDGRRGH
jgi:hypothetical protein